ncbi:MAG: hypothetical protein AABX89_01265 [Candidatus Thermoplasmatota archaeon]
MDVLDAGVFVSKWEAPVPKQTQMAMWGPLQAREMGLDGWEVQDGGETGFILHSTGTHLRLGRGTATLIFVRRLGRAFLTITMAGYPADAAPQQRKLDAQPFVSACEIFLGRLAKESIRFAFMGEMTLVDNTGTSKVIEAAPAKALGGGRRALSDDAIETVGKRKSDVWEV